MARRRAMRGLCCFAWLAAARSLLVRRVIMVKTLGFGILFAAACTTQGTQIGNDELAGENNDGEAAKADSAHDNFDYLLVEKTGQCTNPITCAPYTLTRVNRTTLKCADGNYHDS